jgi:hypothetical protein
LNLNLGAYNQPIISAIQGTFYSIEYIRLSRNTSCTFSSNKYVYYMHIKFSWNFCQNVFTLTIYFIALNVAIEFVLIYRPHRVQNAKRGKNSSCSNKMDGLSIWGQGPPKLPVAGCKSPAVTKKFKSALKQRILFLTSC